MAWALRAALLGAALGVVPAAVAAPAGADSSPEVVQAWLMLGESERALREAQALAGSDDADWRDHAVYIEVASASHLRWAVTDEYRWLAQQEPMDPLMFLLASWSSALQAQGEQLDDAIVELERTAVGQGPAGAQLLARGLIGVGEFGRAVQALQGLRGTEATRLRVEALVGAGAHREAALQVAMSLEQRPRHPDVAAALWERGVPERPVRKARRKAVKAAEALLEEDDPEVLLAAWQVLARAKRSASAQRASDAISSLVPGLVLPDRLPYGRVMLEHLGEGLARTGQESSSAELTAVERARVAAVRARTLREDGLVDQARRAYREAIELDGGDPELLLEAAALHLDVEPQRSLAWVGQALLMLASEPGLAPAERRGAIARGLELQASSLRALEHHDQALSHQLVASLLQPTPQGLFELATLQEQQGSPEAALESLALAAALGSDRARAEMERLYRGPASVEALVGAVATDLQHWVAAAPLPAEAERLLAGVSLSTTAGDLSFDAVEGEVVVLVFWASWCAPCAQELPIVAQLSTSWRDEGLPVRVVAVSVDEREADYRRGAKRFAELDLALAWEPALARRLDVDAVPATRLLDPRGQAGGRLQGFHEGHEQRLDALVRSLLEPRAAQPRTPEE